MSMIRTKDFVPQSYVSESRDFQIFTRVLDFVQNSTKFDIDTMTSILDTDVIPPQYVDRLKSKLGFFTSETYDDRTLKIVLSAFPHIMKYKGSLEGIERCVHTFLHILGYSDKSRVEVYNNHPKYNYVVRVGILHTDMNLTVLKDMLSYVLPTGYLLEIYTFVSSNPRGIPGQFDSSLFKFVPTDAEKAEFNIIRVDELKMDSDETSKDELRTDTLNTANLSMVMDTDDESYKIGGEITEWKNF